MSVTIWIYLPATLRTSRTKDNSRCLPQKTPPASSAIFYELVTRYDISVDQFFFPNKEVSKTTERRQLDSLLDGMSDNGLHIVTETAKAVIEVEKTTE